MHENYIKPIIEEDINVWTLFEKKDGNIYCMGSIKEDRFIQLDENNKDAIQAAVGYMDGSISPVGVVNMYNRILHTFQCFKCSLHKMLPALYQYLNPHIIRNKIILNKLSQEVIFNLGR